MDTISAYCRSENMRKIRSSNTSPERTVRSLLFELGYRGYRLNRMDLPGKPDIVFSKRKLAIFIHGCFWHSHSCNEGTRKPQSNREYWLPKLAANQKRDRRAKRMLKQAGWRVETLWECNIAKPKSITKRLQQIMES